MEDKNSNIHKLFFAFGILTVICGIYLIFIKDYVSGISGTLVGIFLLYQGKEK